MEKRYGLPSGVEVAKPWLPRARLNIPSCDECEYHVSIQKCCIKKYNYQDIVFDHADAEALLISKYCYYKTVDTLDAANSVVVTTMRYHF